MNFSPGLGAVYFAAAVTDRLGTLIGESVATGPPVVGGKPSYAFVPIDLVFSEDVKNRSGDFSAVYRQCYRSRLQSVAAFGGPCPVTSSACGVSRCHLRTPRAATRKRSSPRIKTLSSTSVRTATRTSRRTSPCSRRNSASTASPSALPGPHTPFLWWQCAVHLDYDQGTVDDMPLPSKPLPPPQPSLVDQLFPNSTAGQAASQDPTQPAQQQRVSPRAYVILEGYAVRAFTRSARPNCKVSAASKFCRRTAPTWNTSAP